MQLRGNRDQFNVSRDYSNSSAGSGSINSRGGQLKVKLRPRNFKQNNNCNQNEKVNVTSSLLEKTEESNKEKRRDRGTRGLAKSGNQGTSASKLFPVKNNQQSNPGSKLQHTNMNQIRQSRIKQPTAIYQSNQNKSLGMKEQLELAKQGSSNNPKKKNEKADDISYQ